jgi:coenzyme F420 hydrogenase subunit beta
MFIRLPSAYSNMQPAATKLSFEASLMENVVNSQRCLACGACVISCPFKSLEYSDQNPILSKECKACGICPKVCPQNNPTTSDLEKSVFGRERNQTETFGIHRQLAIAQSTTPDILNVCQDGGVVTALLTYAFEHDLIDAAILSGVSEQKPLLPAPRLVTTAKEAIACSGTRYFYSPNILALDEAIKQKKTRVAFVGTPCQIRALRQMSLAGLRKHVAPIQLEIGLLCSECFDYQGLMENHIAKTMSINPSTIKKMNIKGKMLITTQTGLHTIPLAEIKPYARKACQHCTDFSSELADISLGGLGLDGWTFAIIRTEKGEQIFNQARTANTIRTRPATEESLALNLLTKLSNKKRQTLPSQS